MLGRAGIVISAGARLEGTQLTIRRMMEANLVNEVFFHGLWDDANDPADFPNERPLLAHYTAMSTLEAIFKNEEIWLSNPLFMNDIEELRFGLLEAAHAFRLHTGIREACGGKGERYEALLTAFEQKVELLSNDDAFDTYLTCFSWHDPKDYDGRLSMWRGYGGNGGGAAVVFDTSRLPASDESPLILARVHYATREDRLRWIGAKLDQFAALLRNTAVPIGMFYIPIHLLLERFKLFSLFTKHHGFEEEREWRLVYARDRDRERKFSPMFGYHIRNERVEPKLKLKPGLISKISGQPSVQLHDLVDRIILGPSASSPMATASVKRMLSLLGKPMLADKIFASSTPYRGTN